MARKRYLTSKVSTNLRLQEVSALAALCHAWGVTQAEDSCRIPARTPLQFKLVCMPGRRESVEEIAAALDELLEPYEDVDEESGETYLTALLGRDVDGRYFFPAKTFYKIQSYIKDAHRRPTPEIVKSNGSAPDGGGVPALAPESSGDQRRSPESNGTPLPVAENSGSPSPSHSPPHSLSHTEETASAVSSARARLSLVVDNDDLGLGDRHPGNIAGWEVWNKFEFNCASKGKRLAFFTIEAMGVLLTKWRDGGSDPGAVVQKAIDAGWMTLHDLDPKDKKPPGDDDDGGVLARIEARANGG